TSPTITALQQLIACEADLQDGSAYPLDQMLDQVEHALVGPVDVLPDQHERPFARQALDARANGGEEDFASALRILLHDFARSLDPQQTTDHDRLRRRGSAVLRLGL